MQRGNIQRNNISVDGKFKLRSKFDGDTTIITYTQYKYILDYIRMPYTHVVLYWYMFARKKI